MKFNINHKVDRYKTVQEYDNCEEEGCAWYDEESRQCAVLSIAKSLRPEWD